jgi:hypothetical protein
MRTHPFFTLTIVAILAFLTGCATRMDNVSGVSKEARQAISEAAVARYPGNPSISRDVQAMAINYPDKAFIEIHNFGNQSIPASTVWVNGIFMTRIEGIAPKSFATVEHGRLLEAGPATTDLQMLSQPVARVELQTPRGLFAVYGPTIKHD